MKQACMEEGGLWTTQVMQETTAQSEYTSVKLGRCSECSRVFRTLWNTLEHPERLNSLTDALWSTLQVLDRSRDKGQQNTVGKKSSIRRPQIGHIGPRSKPRTLENPVRTQTSRITWKPQRTSTNRRKLEKQPRGNNSIRHNRTRPTHRCNRTDDHRWAVRKPSNCCCYQHMYRRRYYEY